MSERDAAGGAYTLIVERSADGPIEVGVLGELRFPAGWYAYVGSALGPGGFARIDRHERVAARESEGYHWHVDCLLGDGASAIGRDFRSPGADAECAIASRIRDAMTDDGSGRVVDGFGASDCDCPSHLVYSERRDRLLEAVDRAHRTVDSK